MSRRTDKVASLLKQEIALMLLRLELPGLTTVIKAEVSPDLKHAKVLISILPDEESIEKQVLEILGQNLYDMQGELNRKLVMRSVPRIHFAVDHSGEYADHINQLLKKTKDNE